MCYGGFDIESARRYQRAYEQDMRGKAHQELHDFGARGSAPPADTYKTEMLREPDFYEIAEAVEMKRRLNKIYGLFIMDWIVDHARPKHQDTNVGVNTVKASLAKFGPSDDGAQEVRQLEAA